MIEFLKDIAYLWTEFPLYATGVTIATLFALLVIIAAFEILDPDYDKKRRSPGRS